MKKINQSIRMQFAFIFSVLLAAVILSCVLINTFFLKKYYINDKMAVMERSFTMINDLFESVDPNLQEIEGDEFTTAFDQICNTNNIDVVVIDSSLNIVKSSVGETSGVSQRLFSYIFKDDPNYLFHGDDYEQIDDSEYNRQNKKRISLRNDHLITTEDYILSITTDPRMHLEYMELMGTLDNEDMIIIRTAVEGVTAGAKLSTRFLIYVGLFVLLVGAVIVWIISTRITRPILELAELSNKMSRLDFSAKYSGDDENEVGYLGHHMNSMSKTLEKTISELKTANNELRMDLENRTKLDEMRSDFISNVSHELKTPIAIIQGYAEGLKDAVNDDPESMEYYCDVIIDESAKMNGMVKSLLTLNQLEFGGEKLSIERFDIACLIRNYVQSAEVLLNQSGARVEIIGPESVFAWGDEYRIEEVFMNYFSNAINHVSHGGEIRITIEENDGLVKVSVFNTGECIPEDALDNIWTKFYKVDKARSREYGGSGVGLSIVKAIMNMHNSRFGVLNHEDGVEFWFELEQSK